MLTGKRDHPEERIGGSVASALIAIMNGAYIVRVHDIPETVEAINLYRAIMEAS
jgi:dihydropteroate synthase